ncbi:hypothetical protein PB1_08457 [Bacillus methanolicus PB1]|uniref:Uncharacterized protein n=1 Tax=Bacillus methanolicus PB1 TaxID=997296 RepID=I3E1K8_BACMT|nr:hypothetical protein [Bacillus methanolicus]EIJ80379.1 hypothetical protein PB1_08457 [Bacillus methanolicus PB1]
MQLEELINKINKSLDELDLVTARKYIEENIELLNKNKALLNSNARALLEFLTDNQKSDVKPLTRQEMSTINSINIYALRFDIRGLKLLIKDKANLLSRKDVVQYLNSDAKTILSGMGVIEKKDQQ